jgi:predicted DNA-binding transcriptional regulator AlpA
MSTTTETPRLPYRWSDLVKITGLSRRFLERALSAGELPKPDRSIRRTHLWHHDTINRWLAGTK